MHIITIAWPESSANQVVNSKWIKGNRACGTTEIELLHVESTCKQNLKLKKVYNSKSFKYSRKID